VKLQFLRGFYSWYFLILKIDFRVAKERCLDYNEIMSILRKNILLALAAALFFFFFSSSANIPENLSPAEIIQRAQEASDHNRYKTALRYYQALLERNPYNMELVCTAEYEIAFIYYKQKQYPAAREKLNDLLDRYDSPDEEILPKQFKRLANIVLLQITEKETPKFPLTLFIKKEKDGQ
jgi:tetratricopeptide (TPR) repeat protein